MCKKLTLLFPVFAVAILGLCASAAHAQDARAAISAASKAMGADDLKTLVYTGTGTEFSFGQAYNASGAWPGWPDKSYTRTINYETPGMARRSRACRHARPTARAAACLPVRCRPSCSIPIAPGRRAADLWSTPYGFLKAAGSQ